MPIPCGTGAEYHSCKKPRDGEIVHVCRTEENINKAIANLGWECEKN